MVEQSAAFRFWISPSSGASCSSSWMLFNGWGAPPQPPRQAARVQVMPLAAASLINCCQSGAASEWNSR